MKLARTCIIISVLTFTFHALDQRAWAQTPETEEEATPRFETGSSVETLLNTEHHLEARINAAKRLLRQSKYDEVVSAVQHFTTINHALATQRDDAHWEPVTEKMLELADSLLMNQLTSYREVVQVVLRDLGPHIVEKVRGHHVSTDCALITYLTHMVIPIERENKKIVLGGYRARVLLAEAINNFDARRVTNLSERSAYTEGLLALRQYGDGNEAYLAIQRLIAQANELLLDGGLREIKEELSQMPSGDRPETPRGQAELQIGNTIMAALTVAVPLAPTEDVTRIAATFVDSLAVEIARLRREMRTSPLQYEVDQFPGVLRGRIASIAQASHDDGDRTAAVTRDAVNAHQIVDAYQQALATTYHDLIGLTQSQFNLDSIIELINTPTFPDPRKFETELLEKLEQVGILFADDNHTHLLGLDADNFTRIRSLVLVHYFRLLQSVSEEALDQRLSNSMRLMKTYYQHNLALLEEARQVAFNAASTGSRLVLSNRAFTHEGEQTPASWLSRSAGTTGAQDELYKGALDPLTSARFNEFLQVCGLKPDATYNLARQVFHDYLEGNRQPPRARLPIRGR